MRSDQLWHAIRRIVFGVVLMVGFAIVLSVLFAIQLLHAALGALSIAGPVIWLLRRALL